MAVSIVTDSSCDLSDDDIADLNVEIVPLFIRFGDDEYVDREEIDVNEFYRKMAESEHLPQTAAPPPGKFVEAFKRGLDSGSDAVVCINISSQISATMESAVQAAGEVEGDIRVVDSNSVTAGLGTLGLNAARLAARGADADEIVAAVEEESRRTRVFGTLNTLENLKKGGRIGGAQAMLGSILSIKPIVDLSSGKVEEAGRQRTRKKALLWLRNKVKAEVPVNHLTVMHGQAEDADTFRDMITATVEEVAATNADTAADVDPESIRMAQIGAIVGAHAGVGVIGVAYQVPD